jgi:hypothetical protein
VRVGPSVILQLGHPALRRPSARVGEGRDAAFGQQAWVLAETLEAFRERFGFGRAIAAPQIGVPRRLIAVNLGEEPFLVVDPDITWRSEETFTMWDDCMSFPGLLVRLRRHRALVRRAHHLMAVLVADVSRGKEAGQPRAVLVVDDDVARGGPLKRQVLEQLGFCGAAKEAEEEVGLKPLAATRAEDIPRVRKGLNEIAWRDAETPLDLTG